MRTRELTLLTILCCMCCLWLQPPAPRNTNAPTYTDPTLYTQNPVNNTVVAGESMRTFYDPIDNFMGDRGGYASMNGMGSLAAAASDGALFQDTYGYVTPHNGNFLYTEIAHHVPSRGFDFNFIVTCSSKRATAVNTLGYGWDHNYNIRLRRQVNGPNDTDWIVDTGYQQTLVFSQNNDLIPYANGPAGSYSTLHYTLDKFGDIAQIDIRNRYGMKTIFTPYIVTKGEIEVLYGRLAFIRDPHGNQMSFDYTGSLLTTIHDTLNRAYTLTYSSNLVASITDFSGRVVTFSRSGMFLTDLYFPQVSGTLTGNDFTDALNNRKRLHFGYDTVPASPCFRQMLSVTNTNEVLSGDGPFLQVAYDLTQSDTQCWVQTLTLGGDNYHATVASATLQYAYNGNTVTVTDRKGTTNAYTFDANAQCTQIVEDAGGTNRTTAFQYNAAGEVTRATQPLGDRVDLVYDATPQMNFNFGNVATMTYTPNARPSDQAQLIESYSWEPIYNGLRRSTDPKGNDVDFYYDYFETASPGTLLTAELQGRYTLAQINGFITNEGIAVSLGDLNGDTVTNQVRGNVIAVKQPLVTLLDTVGVDTQNEVEGNTQQIAGASFTYNSFGQRTSMVDEEENPTFFFYYTAATPGTGGFVVGGGGYLGRIERDTTYGSGLYSSLQPRNAAFFGDTGLGRNVNLDGTHPDPTEIKTDFEYDVRGNVVRQVDGRGIATEYVYNALDQIIQATRAADLDDVAGREGGLANTDETTGNLEAYGYRMRFAYDANNNLIAEFTENKIDAGLAPRTQEAVQGAPLPYPTGVAFTVPEDFFETYYYHDILDNLRRQAVEADTGGVRLTSQFGYDANENRNQVTYPLGNQETWNYDVRDLMTSHTRGFGSGDAATTTYAYDANRNLERFTDATPTDGNPDFTLYLYDGFDRVIEIRDPVRSQTFHYYDANSNLELIEAWGRVGGASMSNTDDSTAARTVLAGNVALRKTAMTYDERDRLVQTDRWHLDAGTYDQGQTVGINPGDDKINARVDYDRKSRLVFSIQDDLQVYETRYDGVDRPLRSIDPLGNERSTEFDDNGNAVRVTRLEKATDALVQDETVSWVREFDALDRETAYFDPLRRCWRKIFDSRGLLQYSTDPKSTVIQQAYTTSTGIAIQNTNGHGCVTRLRQDAAGRLLETEHLMTFRWQGDDAAGDGTLDPTLDTDQGGGAGNATPGIIRMTQAWDLNSRLLSRTDDNGNTTLHSVYDDLNRLRQITYADATTKAMNFDGDDNLTSYVDQNGTTVTQTYDDANRRVRVQAAYAGGNPHNLTGTTEQRWEYDGLSRMTRSLDGNLGAAGYPAADADDNECVYAYDSLGHLLVEEQNWGGAAAQQVSYDYADDDKRVRLTYPGADGYYIDYTHDALDRLETLTKSIEDPELGENRYWYIGKSRLLQRRLYNGALRTHHYGQGSTSTYDANWNLFVLGNTSAGETGGVSHYNYSYGRTNQRKREIRIYGIYYEESTFYYDAQDRQVDFVDESSLGPNPRPLVRWQDLLDGVANRVARTDINSATATYAPNEMNELVTETPAASPAVTYTYDDNGNRTQKQALGGTPTTHEYDFLNRLRNITVTGGQNSPQIMSYDAGNRRVRLQVGGFAPTDKYFYYDGMEVIQDNHAACDQPLARYMYGGQTNEVLTFDKYEDPCPSVVALEPVEGEPLEGEPLSGQPVQGQPLGGGGQQLGGGVSTLSETLYYVHDANLWIVAIEDAAGEIVERTSYDDPYGNPVYTDEGRNLNTDQTQSSTGSPFLMRGYRLDPDATGEEGIGLVYLINRHYDTHTGNFIQRDPLMIWGDIPKYRTPGSYHAVTGFGNPYPYTTNNPANWIDPMGLIPEVYPGYGSRYVDYYTPPGKSYMIGRKMRELLPPVSYIFVSKGAELDWGEFAMRAWRPSAVFVNSIKEAIDYAVKNTSELRYIEKIQFVGHGSAGQISIGDDTLDSTGVRLYKGEFKRLNGLLHPDAEILLTGCAAGAWSEGTELLRRLADLLGRKVIAPTGSLHVFSNLGRNYKIADPYSNVRLTGSNNGPDDASLEERVEGELKDTTLTHD